MNRLSKEKRQHLVLVTLVTCIVLAGLWYGVIRIQHQKLGTIAERIKTVEKELAQVKSTISRAEQIEADLEEFSVLLSKCEGSMATGDIYAWIITKIREFKTPYRVDIPQFSQIKGPEQMNLLPDFPYQQASLTVAGTGRFHDIGVFLADFENAHPFMRLCNLVLEPANAGPTLDKQALAFRVDVVALIKPPAPVVN